MTVDHTVSSEWRTTIDSADAATLLLCLVHATGDESLLDRFGPGFARKVVYSRPTIEADEETQAKIRDLALEVLPTTTEPAIGVPDDALFKKMAAFITLEEDLDDKFVPYLLEMCGFEKSRPVFDPEAARPSDDFKVLIIGGGMSGMATGIRLGDAGFNYRILEAAHEFGGTWNHTYYPGVAVDTPSHFYSYSFELNPSWSKYYPGAREYHEYMLKVARKYDLYSHTTFGARVESCTWDEEALEWVLVVRHDDGTRTEERANAVASALGFLNTPKRPNVPGEADFTGEIVHSAEWSDEVDPSGKKVVVVGTGATAIQLVADITPLVAELTVVQREPHWVFANAMVTKPVPDAERHAMENIPFYQQWYRTKIHWFAGDINFEMITVDPEWIAEHGNASISSANDLRRIAGLKYLNEQFADRPDLLEKLTPKYPPFGKRPTMDPGFYDALKQPHVHLVTGALDSYTATGIRLQDGTEIDVDMVILATGYNLDWHSSIKVTGRDGKTLSEMWEDGENPRAHRSLMLPGLPNFFNLAGPNGGANHGGGHNVNSENDAQFVTGALQWLQVEGAAALEPTEEAFEAYDQQLLEKLDRTIWHHDTGTSTYYRNSAGRAILPYPGLLVDRWQESRKPDPDEFRLYRR